MFFYSCNMKLNLDFLLETLWEYLSLIRVYTKKPGQPPDFEDGLILRKGVTVEHVCHAIHRTLAQQFKYALVWVSITFNVLDFHNINSLYSYNYLLKILIRYFLDKLSISILCTIFICMSYCDKSSKTDRTYFITNF